MSAFSKKVADDGGDVPMTETPVLIVGSSMVGMTLSALLAKQGLSGCITVEKHSSTAIHPRAALFHPRTMQIYHELGLYSRMRDESVKHYDEHAGLYNVETLAGKHLSTYMDDLNQGLEAISPVSRLFLTQQMFEPLLRESAVSHGADLRFSAEMVDFRQDDAGVTATVIDITTGKTERIRAKYLVAADGAKSKVRERLGIRMISHGVLSESITIYFKADLGSFISGKYNGVIYVNNDRVRGFFRLNKSGDDGFLVVSTYGPKGEDSSRFPAVDITKQKAGEILRAAIGADVRCEITHLAPWTARCDVAETYNVGRVLITGDAAHVNPPHGGFGGNTGIQDAHNLAWKLSMTLKGKAGRDLVEKTYNDERQPVGQKTVNQVFAKYIARTDAELLSSARWQAEMDNATFQPEAEVPEEWLELGYRYHSQAVLSPHFDDILENPQTAKGLPGSLARHVLIATEEQPENKLALAELLGQTFVLVIGEDAVAWREAVSSEHIRESRDVLRHCVLAGSANQAFYDKYAISPTGCVLIRPDAVVAWSSAGPPTTDGPQTLKGVLRKLLVGSSRGWPRARI